MLCSSHVVVISGLSYTVGPASQVWRSWLPPHCLLTVVRVDDDDIRGVFVRFVFFFVGRGDGGRIWDDRLSV